MEETIKELGVKIDAMKETQVSKDELKALKDELETIKSNNKECELKSNIEEMANRLVELETKGESKKEKSLAEQLKEKREDIKSILSGDKSVEVVVKADTLRASIVDNTEAVRLTDIGQLGVKRRALYDFFTKIPIGDGNHNGTISYIDWDEATTVRAAAVVAEGGTFPESTAKFAEYTKKLVKVGDTLPVSEEFGEDEVLAAAELRNFLNINVSTIIDNKIAVGAGGADIEGLYTAAPTYTPVASGITDANIKDLVRKMRTSIVKTRGSKYQPDFVAANSDTIDRYFLKKDANNNYMFDSETGMIAGLSIVEDNNLADNTLVVGDGRFGRVYEKSGVVLSEGLSGTQYVEDMKTIKARARLLFLIRNVDKTGFLKVTDITTALATLATA
jgi:HK97 family phage major capsid protein